jgi:hypothetical protein
LTTARAEGGDYKVFLSCFPTPRPLYFPQTCDVQNMAHNIKPYSSFLCFREEKEFFPRFKLPVLIVRWNML